MFYGAAEFSRATDLAIHARDESARSAEEQAGRLRDKDYWLPLKKELEAMRRER